MIPILSALVLGATPAGPLVADPPVADRGEVRTGPPLVQSFTVTHRGTADVLRITGAEASCGCLKPVVSRTELNPGEQAAVTLTVNTLTQPAGPNTWRATVRYQVGEAEGALDVVVSARLVAEVTVTPPALAFSTAAAAAQTLSVTDRRPTPLTVVSAATTSPHLTATIRPAATADGARTQAVEMAVAAEHPVGRFDETLVLLTDDQACRELRIPVKVVKRPPGGVTATPATLDLRLPRGQGETSRLVQLRSPDGRPVRVAGVDAGHPLVRAKWSDASGPAATLRLTVAAGDAPAGTAEVRVRLAEPAGQDVVVPVSWTVP